MKALLLALLASIAPYSWTAESASDGVETVSADMGGDILEPKLTVAFVCNPKTPIASGRHVVLLMQFSDIPTRFEPSFVNISWRLNGNDQFEPIARDARTAAERWRTTWGATRWKVFTTDADEIGTWIRRLSTADEEFFDVLTVKAPVEYEGKFKSFYASHRGWVKSSEKFRACWEV
jgi:hypothetical protein